MQGERFFPLGFRIYSLLRASRSLLVASGGIWIFCNVPDIRLAYPGSSSRDFSDRLTST